MGDRSHIEWTDATWNPVRGCSIVSEGCRNCYAMRQAHRLGGEGMPYEGLIRATPGGPKWTGEVRTVPELLDQPLRWRKPRRIFVNSMSDLFHPAVPDEFIARVWAVMHQSRRHVFQVLTKRPERMAAWLGRCGNGGGLRWITHNGTEPERAYNGTGIVVGTSDRWPLPNVWLGTSAEDQAALDERAPHLIATPAAVRFLSLEPLLGPIAFPLRSRGSVFWGAIHWVIVGGESGPGARPMHPDWPREIRDQCVSAGVPFFFKQWGAWSPVWYTPDGERHYLKLVNTDRERIVTADDVRPIHDGSHAVNMVRVGKKAAGRELDGRAWDEYPCGREVALA